MEMQRTLSALESVLDEYPQDGSHSSGSSCSIPLLYDRSHCSSSHQRDLKFRKKYVTYTVRTLHGFIVRNDNGRDNFMETLYFEFLDNIIN